jgi:hypothetical protein
MEWIDCKERMPPRPETPYKMYLVWVVQQLDGATGTSMRLQLDRTTGDWMPPGRGRAGACQVVTHWSTVLDDLGSPEPKPYGPRGSAPNAGATPGKGLPNDWLGAWQPIATAPRDGSRVLIYTPEAERQKVQEAYWATPWEGAPDHQCWWSTPPGPAGRGYTILQQAVTHWMPLPVEP